MKCPNCGGKGKYKNVFGKVDGCYYCLGTGEVNGKGEQVQTNEEWFCQLSTEEKAKVFANATYSTAETPLTILWGGKKAEQKKWELWLKQPHTFE